MDRFGSRRTVVVKMGGSVIAHGGSYEACAQFIAGRLHPSAEEKFVVVVSAQEGLTDALERTAVSIAKNPRKRTLDLLWSTGEIRSVALLSLHLEALGVEVAALNVHEAGLCVLRGRNAANDVVVWQDSIWCALAEYDVVVVPGFFATDGNRVITSLGRGGSDLTAVLVAEAINAAACELIKDVSGYFTLDPREFIDAQHVPLLSYCRALEMADAGCELVQKEALKRASEAKLQLVVRSLEDETRRTVISWDGENAESHEGRTPDEDFDITPG